MPHVLRIVCLWTSLNRFCFFLHFCFAFLEKMPSASVDAHHFFTEIFSGIAHSESPLRPFGISFFEGPLKENILMGKKKEII
jgi:hypothetical protein